MAFTNKVYIRALLLFALSFFEPMDWNWLQVELVFVDSYIGIQKFQLAIVLLALSLPDYLKKPYKLLPLFLIMHNYSVILILFIIKKSNFKIVVFSLHL